MPIIGFATSKVHSYLTDDDRLAQSELRKLGYQCEPVVWDAQIDWTRFDCIIIRSCWDYHKRLGEFLSWIDRLQTLRVPLLNSQMTVYWNSNKKYLRELEIKGQKIAPTLWSSPQRLAHDLVVARQEGWNDVIIKPVVSASAYFTRRITFNENDDWDAVVADMQNLNCEIMVQAYQHRIETLGEWSLMFFQNRFSHAVLKKPRQGDFRVQEEHGGKTVGLEAPPKLVLQATRVLETVEQPCLYARVDGIFENNQFVLMELELIEPFLFLGSHPDAPRRFARAIVDWVSKHENQFT